MVDLFLWPFKDNMKMWWTCIKVLGFARLLKFVLLFCVCLCGYMSATVRRSEELIPSFSMWALGIWLRLSGLQRPFLHSKPSCPPQLHFKLSHAVMVFIMAFSYACVLLCVVNFYFHFILLRRKRERRGRIISFLQSCGGSHMLKMANHPSGFPATPLLWDRLYCLALTDLELTV